VSASVLEHFAPVPDFRIERNKLYALPEILLLVVSGVLSGADGWEAIEQFGQSKLEWSRRFAPFRKLTSTIRSCSAAGGPRGMPSATPRRCRTSRCGRSRYRSSGRHCG
jgi:hypothetical protein